MKRIILNSLLIAGCTGMLQYGALAQEEKKEVIIEKTEKVQIENEKKVQSTQRKEDADFNMKLSSDGDEVSVTLRGAAKTDAKGQAFSSDVRDNITDLVIAMKAEIAEIRAQEKAGEISKSEMAAEISKIAGTYSEMIEAKVESFNLENKTNIESELEWSLVDSLPSDKGSSGESTLRIKMKGKPKPAKRTYSGFNLAFGWHTLLLNNTPVEGAIYPEIEFWRGGFSEIGYMLNTRLGGTRSPLFLNYGASLMYNRADIGGGNYFLQNENGPMFVDRQLDVRKSSLRTAYVNGTVGFKIAPGRRRGFHMEANAYGGVLFRTKQDIEYRSASDERVTEERRGNYGVNRFNYGVSAAVGYHWVSVYARYDLSSLFNNTSVYDFTPLSVGFKFNLM